MLSGYGLLILSIYGKIHLPSNGARFYLMKGNKMRKLKPVLGKLNADECKKQTCMNRNFWGEKCQNTFWTRKGSNQDICNSCRNEEAEKYLDI